MVQMFLKATLLANDIYQLFSFQITLEVVNKKLKNHTGAVLGSTSVMGGYNEVRCVPKRVFRRQWFQFAYIQASTSDLIFL